MVRKLPDRQQSYRLRLEEHVRDRLAERYGLVYTLELRNRIIDAIERNQGVVLLYREGERGQLRYKTRVHYRVQVSGMPVHVVYDPTRKVIVTVLALEGME